MELFGQQGLRNIFDELIVNLQRNRGLKETMDQENKARSYH